MDKVLKKCFLLYLSLLITGETIAQPKGCIFKKRKWDKSEDYRYEIVKCKSFFKMLHGKTKQEILDVLGYPDLVDMKNMDEFTYCLDREKKIVFDNSINKQVCCFCTGSLIVIHFSDEKVWEVTRVHTE